MLKQKGLFDKQYEEEIKKAHNILSLKNETLYSPFLFWIEYKNKFTWTLIPTQYAYDAYTKWIEGHPMYKQETKNEFIRLSDLYFQKEQSWRNSTKQVVRSHNKMMGNDAVAIELSLDKWINIEKNEKYRGYVKAK